jgi:hypothetical protein
MFLYNAVKRQEMQSSEAQNKIGSIIAFTLKAKLRNPREFTVLHSLICLTPFLLFPIPFQKTYGVILECESTNSKDFYGRYIFSKYFKNLCISMTNIEHSQFS